MPESLARNLRRALRSMRREPGTTALIVFALALGIGTNTAMFSVINGVLLQPLPYPRPERILVIMESNPEAGLPRFGISPPNFQDLRSQGTEFEAMAAYVNSTAAYTDGEEPLRLAGLMVSHGFFEVLAVPPLIGRTFTPDEDRPGAPRVVILSHDVWRRLFGGDRRLVGRAIDLDGEPHTVIGVMPPGFRTLSEMETGNDFWVPLAMDYAAQSRSRHYLVGLGRLREGSSVADARANLQAVAGRLAREYPATNAGWGVAVDRLQERLIEGLRPALLILWGAVGFLLVIAAANVANLMLARLASREWEIALQRALGAERRQIMGQLMTESVLVALVGGFLGTLAGEWIVRSFIALNSEAIPRVEAIRLDGRVALFAAAVSVVTGVLFGVLPALHSLRVDPGQTLKRRAHGTTRRRGWTRDALVVTEVALALVVVICAGLLIRSFALLERTSPGFDPERVLVAEVSLPGDRYAPETAKPAQFFRELLARLQALPGVEHAGMVSVLPLSDFSFSGTVWIEGREVVSEDQASVVTKYVIDPGYPEAMGITLRRGRRFNDQDIAQAAPVVLVSESAARRFWPSANPIGKRITSDNLLDREATEPIQWSTVVGVVSELRTERLTEAGGPTVFYPYLQNPLSTMTLVLRTNADPSRFANSLRRTVWQLDPKLPVYNLTTLEQHVADSIARPRFNSLLIGLFATLGLVLAALGVHGVISQAVAQSLRDVGIRIALGAQRRSVLGWFVKRGMLPVMVGIGIGVVAAFFLAGLLQSLLYGLTKTDTLTFTAAVGIVCAVALIACTVPTYRAVRVDPLRVLREE